MKDHRLIDERSLAFDLAIAEKIRRNPALVDKARDNLQRWLPTSTPALLPTLLEWQKLLESPQEILLEFLVSKDEHSTRLRQSSPFCGILTREERTQILLTYQARESLAA